MILPATGHSYKYSNNGENHTVSCASCALNNTQEHSYVNGVCPCGAAEMIVDEELVIYHTLDLASDISIMYVVKTEALKEYDSFYLECEIPNYEGEKLLNYSRVTVEPVLKEDYYYFTLTGIIAVQMNDTVKATLHMTKNGATYISKEDLYSVGAYAYSQLNKAAASDCLKTLCADLLRYGAAAQTYKGYRTQALADAAMTDAQKAYLSDLNAVSFGSNNQILGDVSEPEVTWAGKTLMLDSKVGVKFVLNASNYSGSIEGLSLRVSYRSYTGEEKSAVLTKLEPYPTGNGWYSFTFDGLIAAELRQVLSAAVFEGERQVSPTLCYSADTYGNNKTGTLLALCKALFAYSDSALAYFQ